MPPCPAPNTCWCYLIRHGETANNQARPRRLQGCRTDPPLSESGERQAEQTASLLAEEPIAAVYSSPLLRARQTAEPIAAVHKLSVTVVEELTEVDVGLWEGRSWEEIQQRDAEAYRLFISDPGSYPYLGGENMSTVQARAIEAFQRLLTGSLGRKVVAVAHNCVNRTYLAHLLGIPLANYRAIPQDNCGVSLLRYRRGRVKLITLNAIAHLGRPCD